VSCNDVIQLQTLLAPTNAQFCILCILILIFSYMFWHSYHPQGAYDNVVKMYSNKMVLK